MTDSTPRRAVFLDRDGVLNHLVEREGALVSPRSAAEFVVFEDAAPATSALRALGFLTFAVTNQPDIARGHLPLAELGIMHERIRKEVGVDDVAFCPHDDTAGCACRKPKPGMLLELARRWGVGLDASYMVGDSWRDIGAGRAAGCHTILLERHQPVEAAADARAASLTDVVRYIQSRQ